MLPPPPQDDDSDGTMGMIHATEMTTTTTMFPGSHQLCLLWSHLRDYTFNGLSQFFTPYLISSNSFRLQTVRRFSMRTHLFHALHIFMDTCLPHDEPCSIKLNFILDSSFLCCAWLCHHTYAHHTCSMLLFHSATTMWLHNVINPHYAYPRQYQ